MKKRYSLLIFLFGAMLSFGQVPIITSIVDGDCAMGTPKLLEIYARGTVDFSQFSIENQSNSNTTWGNTTDLSMFGMVTNGFVYVMTSTSEMAFESEFPSLISAPLLVSGVMNVNGNDRIRIIENKTSNVVDQYGTEGVNGTGTTWEYKDAFAKRKNGTAPNSVFNEADWTFSGVSALNGLGICQGGTDTFETVMDGIGNYETSTLSIDLLKTSRVSLFPNPSNTGFITIRTASKALMHVSVFNLLGKTVMSEILNKENRLNISKLNSGVYLVKVSQNDISLSKKLVIE